MTEKEMKAMRKIDDTALKKMLSQNQAEAKEYGLGEVDYYQDAFSENPDNWKVFRDKETKWQILTNLEKAKRTNEVHSAIESHFGYYR